MARIRSIKPEFFTSESVSQLPLRARLTWIGLWTHCDNHGRTRDNVKLIKAAIWPLDDVGLRDIEEDLATLAEHGRIVRYSVGGKRYLAITNWGEHQYGADKGEAKHPGPAEADGCLDESRPRPDESELDQDESGPNQGSWGHDGRGQARAKRATRIPDDFAPTDEMITWALGKGWPRPWIDAETEKFTLYWQAESGAKATKLDWPKTWRRWLLGSAERKPPLHAVTSGGVPWPKG